jgi:glycosyltransferase involved in cell wall biosynthesis
MNSNPLVSVLVPVFNQFNVIEQTLNSIISQTYKNIEIIVTDDCSTDHTQELIDRIAKNNSCIKLYLQNPNLGITQNYNFAASKAAGKYVAIFAGDDVMFPDKIAEQVELLEKNPDASFCHHAVEVLDSVTNKSRGVISHAYKNEITSIHDVLRNLGIPGAMAIMCRRDAIRNPMFNPEITTASDWLQMIHLTMSGRGLYINKALCFYRQDFNYNGKDPIKYERDFIKTIEITRSTYATTGDAIDKSCDYALARYSIGAGFRRLVRNEPVEARILLMAPMKSTRLFLPSTFLYLLTFFPVGSSFLSLIKKYKNIW